MIVATYSIAACDPDAGQWGVATQSKFLGVGSVVRYTIRGDRSGTFEILEWDPGRKVVWDGPPLRWAGGAARPRLWLPPHRLLR